MASNQLTATGSGGGNYIGPNYQGWLGTAWNPANMSSMMNSGWSFDPYKDIHQDPNTKKWYLDMYSKGAGQVYSEIPEDLVKKLVPSKTEPTTPDPYEAARQRNIESARNAIPGIEGDLNFALGQLQKQYDTDAELIRKAQEQNEQNFKVQSHINSADWREGENSALAGSSKIITGGKAQLSNEGGDSGSMLNDLYNRAISEFGKNESQVNREYGKAQSKADYDINMQRRQTELALAKAWDDMMSKQNEIRGKYAGELRNAYNTAEDYDAARNVVGGIDFDRRAPGVNTTYTARPISDFYKNTKIGLSNAAKDNRISGTTNMGNTAYGAPAPASPQSTPTSTQSAPASVESNGASNNSTETNTASTPMNEPNTNKNQNSLGGVNGAS